MADLWVFENKILYKLLYLWQFQNFTTQKPCCKHGFAAFRLDGMRSGT